MKKLMKLFLVCALVIASSSSFAQKFGHINTQELISVMPERDSADVKLKAFAEELSTQLEGISVEYSKKADEYTKGLSALSESVKQLKLKELDDLKARYAEFEQIAQEDLGNKQQELYAPIIERAREAIKKVAKAQGLTAVFDDSVNPLAYFDEATVVNLLPLTKKELGIKDVAAPATTPAAKK